jgi:hypothetical protein
LRTNCGLIEVPARTIQIISPSGFENFFRELSEMLVAGPPDSEQLKPLAVRYGVQFGQPEWLPDVVARYNLTQPPMEQANDPAGRCAVVTARPVPRPYSTRL